MTQVQSSTSKNHRICILSQFYPPELGAPQTRLSELGKRLSESGWQVEVLTALPNYPTGRVFAGYSTYKVVEELQGGLRAIRVPLLPSKGGFIRRLISYFSFVFSACFFGPSRCKRPDLLYVESPPLFIGYAAWYLSWRWRCPYVLNVSDLWPDSAIRMGVIRPGLLTRLAKRLEIRMYRKSHGVTGTAQGVLDAVRELSPSTPVELILNGVETTRFGKQKADAAARALLGEEAGPVAVFAGLLGLAQGLDQVLDLAKSLPPTVPGRFVLIGDGPAREELERRIVDESIRRIKILPPQPRERIPAILAAADLAVVTLSTSLPGSVPSKIYEAMASELPILMIADGEAAERVQSAGAGLTVVPGDTEAMVQAFTRLCTDDGLRKQCAEAGRRAAETVYHRQKIAETLDAFLRRVLEPGDDVPTLPSDR